MKRWLQGSFVHAEMMKDKWQGGVGWEDFNFILYVKQRGSHFEGLIIDGV